MHLSISQQDSEAPYNFGRSVVPRVWSQYCIDHSVRIYANPLSQFAEVVAIPLQILLVVFRHMLCNGAILSRASFQTMVGSNAVMVVKISMVVSVTFTSTFFLMYSYGTEYSIPSTDM